MVQLLGLRALCFTDTWLTHTSLQALLQQSKPECLPTVPVSEFQLDITPLASASSLRTPPGSPPSIRPEPSAPPRTLSAVAHPLSCLPADVSLEIGTGEKREEVLPPESMKMVARLLRVRPCLICIAASCLHSERD